MANSLTNAAIFLRPLPSKFRLWCMGISSFTSVVPYKLNYSLYYNGPIYYLPNCQNHYENCHSLLAPVTEHPFQNWWSCYGMPAWIHWRRRGGFSKSSFLRLLGVTSQSLPRLIGSSQKTFIPRKLVSSNMHPNILSKNCFKEQFCDSSWVIN